MVGLLRGIGFDCAIRQELDDLIHCLVEQAFVAGPVAGQGVETADGGFIVSSFEAFIFQFVELLRIPPGGA